jgi:peptide-methionine (S)-S-oxide reductase
MKRRQLSLCAMLIAQMLGFTACARADEQPRVIPAPLVDETKPPGGSTEVAVVSGGCFWGMQGLFEHVKGVREVVAGYSGGAADQAQYETVSSGTTGHAESVRISFDPSIISYGQILRVFFSVAHDPTELNRQGPDSGSQYRSNIFFANAAQEKIARAYMSQLANAHVFGQSIATRLDQLNGFYPAEGYHQDYLLHNPDSPYIVVNDLPKVGNLKRLYPTLYRDQPARLASAWR